MTIPPWPTSSPRLTHLKLLLWAIGLSAIACAFLPRAGILLAPYLVLSLPALSHGFVWTLLTYPFAYPAAHLIDLILRLGLDLVLLWFFGSPLIERTGSKHFFFLFFGATLAGGLAAAGALHLFQFPFFSGPSPALLGLYTAWALLHTRHDSSRPTWLAALLIGGSLFLDLFAHQWPTFLADLAGVLFGYIFCIMVEKVTSPITWLQPLERGLHRLCEKCHRHKMPQHNKVVDFKTGQPILDDDQFMDAMLARISLYGESVLTPDEKNRMRKISERKSIKPLHDDDR